MVTAIALAAGIILVGIGLLRRRTRSVVPTVTVEKIDRKLMLPLATGGRELIGCTRAIGRIANVHLKVEIRDWTAQKLDLGVGSRVEVDNVTGEFRLQKSSR